MFDSEPKIGRPTGRYNRYYRRILLTVDFVILNAVFFVVTLMNPGVAELHGRIVWLLLNLAYFPVARYQGRVHKIRALQMDRLLLLTLQGVLGQALLFIFLLYLMGQEPLPLEAFAEFYGMFTPLLMLWWGSAHYLLKAYRRSGRSFSRIVIVGCRPTAERLLTEMRLDPGFGYRCQGFSIFTVRRISAIRTFMQEIFPIWRISWCARRRTRFSIRFRARTARRCSW